MDIPDNPHITLAHREHATSKSSAGQGGPMKRRRWGAVVVWILIGIPLAWAGAPALPEPDPELGSIGIAVRAKPPASFGQKMPAVQIFFVRLDDDTDAFGADDVIPSNFSNKKQVYLLNAEPGRYVAVAAGLQGTSAPATVGSSAPAGGGVSTSVSYSVSFDYQAFFSMEMISETEIEVFPNQMAFMGDFLVSTSTKIKKADEAQSHYMRILAPNAVQKGFMARAFSGQAIYTAQLKSAAKDSAGAVEFWTKSRDKVFKKEPIWQEQAQYQLAALEDAP
jgi:hypothetical protein